MKGGPGGGGTFTAALLAVPPLFMTSIYLERAPRRWDLEPCIFKNRGKND